MDFVPVPGGRMFSVVIKHPLAEIMAYVDWSSYIETLQTTVISSEWVNQPDSSVVLTGPVFSLNVACVEISGGAPDRAHIVENRVDLADGSRSVFRLSVYLAAA